jgi:hypothetical protein
MFECLSAGELTLLRQTLCRFFQDRRVKVSLFLQDQIQLNDGAIVISPKGRVPKGTEVPGAIRSTANTDTYKQWQDADIYIYV